MGFRLFRRIKQLQKEKKAVILAHNYQPPEIQDIADVVGDSLELAQHATTLKEDIMIVCGVQFMAETVKILCPDKKVILPAPDAGCPLADQLTPEMILAAKEAHPGAEMVTYVNSTAACKAVSDITCTSSNAADVVRSLKGDTVLFGPDSNLGGFVQEQVPEKTIIMVPEGGNCPVHAIFTTKDAAWAKEQGLMTMCHPECPEDVRHACDIITSTGGMIREAKEAPGWMVLTEREMAFRLQTEYPKKNFYTRDSAVCEDMKKITLKMVGKSLLDEGPEVILPDDLMEKARAPIERMLAVSKPKE